MSIGKDVNFRDQYAGGVRPDPELEAVLAGAPRSVQRMEERHEEEKETVTRPAPVLREEKKTPALDSWFKQAPK